MSVRTESIKDKGNQYIQKYLECVNSDSVPIDRFGKV
jgi:hypothetical protein